MKKKISISVVVPTRNEESNLASCLKRLELFDEIIVVDSGSTDATCQIAAEYGASVLQFKWNGRYPKKRNWILLNYQLRNDWVLFLDADELVTADFCSEVSTAIAKQQFDAFWLRYTNHFLGRPLNHGDPQRKLALLKVGRALYERIDESSWSALDMEVHEHPIVEGLVGEITSPIDHRDDRGIVKFIERHKDYALWEARRTWQIRTSERGAWDHLTERQKKKYDNIGKWWFAWLYFAWTYIAKRGFLDGKSGFAYAFYKLWYFWTIRLLLKEIEQSNPSVIANPNLKPEASNPE